MATHVHTGPRIMARGSLDRLEHVDIADADPLEVLRLYLYHLAIVGYENWDEGNNDQIYEKAFDLIEDQLCTAGGDPAEQNIAWLRSRGWRVNIVHKHDKDLGPFWYGELYVWGPYHITFKWTGQRSVGV